MYLAIYSVLFCLCYICLSVLQSRIGYLVLFDHWFLRHEMPSPRGFSRLFRFRAIFAHCQMYVQTLFWGLLASPLCRNCLNFLVQIFLINFLYGVVLYLCYISTSGYLGRLVNCCTIYFLTWCNSSWVGETLWHEITLSDVTSFFTRSVYLLVWSKYYHYSVCSYIIFFLGFFR